MKDLVAFYQTEDQAERVKDELLSSGFDRNDVKTFKPNDRGEPGFWESVKEAFGFADESDRQLYAEAARRGGYAVALSFDNDEDEPSYQRAIQIMRRHTPIDLDQQAMLWRQQGWTGSAQQAQTQAQNQTTGTPAASRNAQGEEVIPVVQEELHVGKRRIEQGGIRVYSRVTEKPVEEQVNLRQERVNVERRAVDRPLTDADQPFQERVIEATETVEQPVVQKQARVVEEVAVNKQVEQETQTVRDTVRRTDVEVEKLGPEHARASNDTEWTSGFVNELAADQRYRGRAWDTIEPDARTSFERRYPGRKWEQVKEDIRRAYDRVRSRS
jgi:uncharacterized protein (TIGR02271 family)